ncbi:hypothetical protein [Nocardia sp. NPDC051750]|uniref:hypothetical protein n=1 Tax=Nocardia sp. NPDC051750 TaxID=3364325 RepID=UPI0037BB08A7
MKSQTGFRIPTSAHAVGALVATRAITGSRKGRQATLTRGEARLAALAFLGVVGACWLVFATLAILAGTEFAVTAGGLVVVAAAAWYHDRRRGNRGRN